MQTSELAQTARAVPSCARDEFQIGLECLRARNAGSALSFLVNAERLGFAPDECAAQRWYCRMLLGDFEGAWRESDDIAMRGSGGVEQLWDGQPFAGRRVIIRCLHGHGDAIQFLRYASAVALEAVSVTVETHPELVALTSKIPGIDRVVTWADGSSKAFTAWDQQIEVMELPRAFRTTLDKVPAKVPYVRITPEEKAQSAVRLGGDGGPRIGLLWGSSEWNPARSIALDDFAPLAALPGVNLYSFQRGPRRLELCTSAFQRQLYDTAVHSPGIEDTAADLSNMDLLITVDTMAAHLAGALGVKTWVLLPPEADWRWMLHREDSPWYPTMTLIRRTGPDTWRHVIGQVAAKIITALSDDRAEICVRR